MLFTNYFSGACEQIGEVKKAFKMLTVNPMERDHLEYQGVDGSIL
jgi:hypothetical protein